MELEKLNYNAKYMINYLIELFFRTHRQYPCNRHNLNRLLTIASLVMAYNGKLLAKEPLLCNKDVTIYAFGPIYTFPLEIYREEKYKNKRSEILESEISSSDDLVPYRYIEEDLNEGVKELLFNVFKTFGAYSKDDLFEYLNEILPFLLGPHYKGILTIDFSGVYELLNSSSFENNIVVDYIMNDVLTVINNIPPNKKKVYITLKRNK